MSFIPGMHFFSKENILSSSNRHLASEPHLRVQILEIGNSPNDELFGNYHGELLIIGLSGKGKVLIEKGEQSIAEGD